MKPLISANWKMHLTHLEAIHTVQELSFLLENVDFEQVEVSMHPPFTALRSVQVLLDDSGKKAISKIMLGAQNCHFEDDGAFTGEVSPKMLAAMNVSYVILGHSERREIFSEDDEMISKKLDGVWRHNMTPILAIGETLEEYEGKQTETRLANQLEAALGAAPPKKVAEMVVAYEPVWAIGSDYSASSEDITKAVEFIRGWIGKNKNSAAAKSVRIQYGGSVKPINASEIMSLPGVDGMLVGGASLDAKEFSRIIQYKDRL